MKPGPRHLRTAHLWLFAAGIEPTDLDTKGVQLVESLAQLLASSERDGRREAAATYLEISESGEHEFGSDDTGEYDIGQLERLLGGTS